MTASLPAAQFTSHFAYSKLESIETLFTEEFVERQFSTAVQKSKLWAFSIEWR
jgi:hypothetical protein